VAVPFPPSLPQAAGRRQHGAVLLPLVGRRVLTKGVGSVMEGRVGGVGRLNCTYHVMLGKDCSHSYALFGQMRTGQEAGAIAKEAQALVQASKPSRTWR
jgi:hypothetical protein